MVTRRGLIAGSAVGALGVLTGCGLRPVGAPTVPSGPIDTDGDLAGSIRFQTWNLRAGYQDYFQGLIDDFVADRPDVRINWIDQPAEGYSDSLQVDAANLNLPDVINIAPDLGLPLARAGLLLDIASARPQAQATYLDGAWDDYTYEDPSGTYAFPWYLNTGPMFYNRALFEEAGLDPDSPPESWDELFDQAMVMGEAAGGDFYMIGQLPSIADLGMYGVELMDDSEQRFTFDSKRAVQMVERYREAYERQGLLPDATVLTATDSGERFQSGQVAFTGGSAYDLDNFRENAPDLYENLGMTEAITNTGYVNMTSQGMAVSSRTDHPEIAIAFAEYLTGQEEQTEFSRLVDVFPSTDGALDDPYFTEDDGTDSGEVRVLSAAQVDQARNHQPLVWTEEMSVELQRQLSDAVVGRTSAQEALSASADQANRLIGATS